MFEAFVHVLQCSLWKVRSKKVLINRLVGEDFCARMHAVLFISKALSWSPEVSLSSPELKSHLLHLFSCAHSRHVVVHCHEPKFADDGIVLLEFSNEVCQ